MQNFLSALRRSIQTENWYGAIFIALTLPDICGSIDDPGKNNSRKRSVAWFDRYVGHAYKFELNGVHHVFMTGGDCYALRCAILHRGMLDVSSQGTLNVVDRFILHHSVGIRFHNIRQGKKLVIDMTTFCEDIAKGVEMWEDEVMRDNDDRRRSLISSLMPLHLPDVVHGNITLTKIENLFG